MAHRDIYIINGQSNAQGVLGIANAPVGVFTDNILNGVNVWNGSAVVPFNCTNVGSSGNGHTWVGVGSSSSGNYAWAHLVCYEMAQRGQSPLIIAVTEGGSALRLATVLNGSHNTDVATLAGTYPTTPILHTALVNRYNTCITALGIAGDTYTVRGVFWDQEEADSDNLDNRVADLTAKFAAFRTLTGNANLPIYYTTRCFNSNFYRPYGVRAAFQVAALSPNNHCMGLYSGSTFDGAHFDAPTMVAIRDWMVAKITGDIDSGSIQPLPSYPAKSYNPYDKAVELMGVSQSNQQSALSYYITNMQSNSLYTNRIASYMFIGNNYALNLKNPSWRPLTIQGATSVSDGLDFDGVNDSCLTNLRFTDFVNMPITDFTMAFYLKENSMGLGQQSLGSINQGSNVVRFYNPQGTNAFRLDISTGTATATASVADNSGMYHYTVRSGVARIFKNGRLFATGTPATTFYNIALRLGIDADDNDYLNNILNYWSFGASMTDAQIETHYQIVLQSLTLMNRQATDTMPVPTWQAIIDYANANTITLPSAGVLTSLQAHFDRIKNIIKRDAYYYCFPNGGLTEAFANINWVNPANYLLTWPNGKTYAATGITLNGTNQYGETNFNPSTQGGERVLRVRASRSYYIETVGGTICDGITTSARNNITLSNSTAQRLFSGSTVLPTAVDMSGNQSSKWITRYIDTLTLFNNGVKSERTVANQPPISATHWIGRSGTTYGSSTYRDALYGDYHSDVEVATIDSSRETLWTDLGI